MPEESVFATLAYLKDELTKPPEPQESVFGTLAFLKSQLLPKPGSDEMHALVRGGTRTWGDAPYENPADNAVFQRAMKEQNITEQEAGEQVRQAAGIRDNTQALRYLTAPLTGGASLLAPGSEGANRAIATGVQQGGQSLINLGVRGYEAAGLAPEGLTDFANQQQVELRSANDLLKSKGLPGKLEGYLSGAVESLVKAYAGGPAGQAGVIATFVATSANEAYSEAKAKGFSQEKALRYAAEEGAVEGLVTTAFSLIGLGGLEKTAADAFKGGTKTAIKEFLKQTGAEITEENMTEMLHGIVRAGAGIDPNAGYSWETFKDTTLQTLLTMGLAEGGKRATGGQEAPSRTELKAIAAASPELAAQAGYDPKAHTNPEQRAAIVSKMEELSQPQEPAPEQAPAPQVTPSVTPQVPTPPLPQERAGEPTQIQESAPPTEQARTETPTQEAMLASPPAEAGVGAPRIDGAGQRTNLKMRQELDALSPENRADALRELDAMPPEQRQEHWNRLNQALYAASVDPVTGLPTRRFFQEQEKAGKIRKRKMAMDIIGLGSANDNVDYALGDAMLEGVGKATAGVQLNAARWGGDELMADADTDSELHSQARELNKILKDLEFEIKNADGTVSKFRGARVVYGLGGTTAEAARVMEYAKGKARETGIRPKKGEFPGFLVEQVKGRWQAPRKRSNDQAQGQDFIPAPDSYGGHENDTETAPTEGREEGPAPVPPKGGRQPAPEPAAESVAERIQREADAGPEAVGMGAGGAGVLMPRTPIRDDVIPTTAQVDNEAVERRMQAAYGMKPERLAGRVKAAVVSLWRKSTRPYEFLPKTKQFDAANEDLRLLKSAPEAIADDVSRTIAAIIDPMGKQQKALFERYLIAKNMQESLQRGEPLRFGFESAKDVDAYVKKLEDAIQQVPEIQKAIQSRQAVVKELVGELQKYDLLPEGADREAYYHQQVLQYMQAESAGLRSLKKKTRAFQKSRVLGAELGAENDYNTDYIQAETKWMRDARAEIAKRKTLENLRKSYDVTDKLQKQYGKEWRKQIPEGYEAWSAVPGNAFYRAVGVPAQIAEAVQSEAIKATPEVAQELAAIADPRTAMIVPTELAQQLRSMEKPKPVGAIESLWRDALRGWKIWTLLNPKRFAGYFLRNVTGDLDPVIGGAPQALKHAPNAATELSGYYRGNLALGKDVRKARDLGVISSSMTAQDIPSLKDVQLFKRFYESKSSLADIPTKYLDVLKKFNEFRESILRLAAFKHYRMQIEAGGKIDYGGANPRTVDSLIKERGADVAAAHLARNLLGDYGNLTVSGSWLRQNLMPFWSWSEVNLTRYPRMIANAVQAGHYRRAGAVGGVYAAGALMRLGAFYGLVYAWNALRYPDEEEELSGDDQSSPHLIFGRTKDGSVIVLRNVGAAGDFAEWFGLQDIIKLFPKYQAGQITAADIAATVGKTTANKAIQGIRPDIKAPIEIATGKGLYPDVFTPRSQDRGELAAGTLGLRDELKAMRGLVTGSGERARKNYLPRLIGVSDVKENDINEVYELRNDFLKSKGKEIPDISGRPTPMKNMKNAARNDDFEAFKEAYTAFRKEGKTFKNFELSIKHLNPIYSMNNADEMEFRKKFLTGQQKERLERAIKHAKTIEAKMRSWWFRLVG